MLLRAVSWLATVVATVAVVTVYLADHHPSTLRRQLQTAARCTSTDLEGGTDCLECADVGTAVFKCSDDCEGVGTGEYIDYPACPNGQQEEYKCLGRDDNNTCIEGLDRDDDAGVWVAVLANIVPTIVIMVLSCGCCQHYRSASYSRAPFNGQPVHAYQQTAQAVVSAPQQVVQIQCPPGLGPGHSLDTMVNGTQIQVVVPQGVAPGQLFQVQVPVVPMATVMPDTQLKQQTEPLINPVTAVAAFAGSGSILDQCAGIKIKQVVNVAELVTGCEMKNKYQGFIWDPSNPMSEGQQIFHFEEVDGGGMQRICCKGNRHLQLNMHEGTNRDGNVQLQFHKSFGLAFCCFCRPEAIVFDGAGQKIGAIDDPFKWCVMDQRIYDPSGAQIYGVAGSICQLAICCPCLGSVQFGINDAAGRPTGFSIQKLFGGCAELMAKVNNFSVAFPPGASAQQKMALIGTTLLIDFEYFEQK
jgi:hypothetical protein